MVAAARLRRAQSRILSARPFAIKMRELLTDIAGRVVVKVEFPRPKDKNLELHPLLQTNVSKKAALLLVTADKGLCGSFNTNLLRRAAEVIQQNEGKEIKFFAAGRKGRDFLKRMGYTLSGEYLNIFNQLAYSHAEIIGGELIHLYQKERFSEVLVIYNEFKSVIQQKLVVERLLPVERPVKISSEQKIDYIFEPEKEKLLDALLPRCVKSHVFRILLESYAAELGARMTAMDSASKNASELIDALTLKLNRTRQAIITREIAELVGGAEALK